VIAPRPARVALPTGEPALRRASALVRSICSGRGPLSPPVWYADVAGCKSNVPTIFAVHRRPVGDEQRKPYQCRPAPRAASRQCTHSLRTGLRLRGLGVSGNGHQRSSHQDHRAACRSALRRAARGVDGVRFHYTWLGVALDVPVAPPQRSTRCNLFASTRAGVTFDATRLMQQTAGPAVGCSRSRRSAMRRRMRMASSPRTCWGERRCRSSFTSPRVGDRPRQRHLAARVT